MTSGREHAVAVAEQWARTVEAARRHVAHLREEGLKELPREPRARVSAPPPVEPVAAPPAPAEVASGAPAAAAGLAAIAARVAECRRCELCKTRRRTVPGQGHAQPQIMFIGEGPGADEDAQGLAFVGRAGQLLTRLLTALGLARDEVFIGNIVKCRPPGNRVPAPEEMQACLPFLREQITLLKPRVIVALGGTAAQGLLGEKVGITRLRGHWRTYEGIDLMPTYHPSYLLRQGEESEARWEVWDDMGEVLRRIGREPPAKKRRKAGA